MKDGSGTLDLFQDVGGLCGPDKGLGILVVTVDVLADGLDQFLDAAKSAAAEPVFGQVAEEAFHHVQPRAAGGREVHVETRMASEPALHLRMLVGRVVVHDHVDLFTSRDHIIDHAQELQPFLMAVPVVAHRNHLAFERVEGGEQRGRAIALVVVGHGSAAAFLHRQAGLSAVQCLNLALFVGAQHQGMLGWIQIQADDVFQFLGELGSRLSLKVLTWCGFSP